MEVTIQKYKDEIIGINLISETGFEQDIVQRFWSGGIKIGELHLEVRKHADAAGRYTINARVKD